MSMLNQNTRAMLQNCKKTNKMAARQMLPQFQPVVQSSEIVMNPPNIGKMFKKMVLRAEDISIECTTRFKIDKLLAK